LKCVAAEVWKRSFGQLMWEMKKYYLRFKEERPILHIIKQRRGNWVVHILRRKCLLKYIIEGEIEGTGR
jgi:hypothetical protein